MSAEKVEETPAQHEPGADPVRRTTWVVLILVLLLFIGYVLSDRYTPWTDHARVDGWVVAISPKVAPGG